MKKILLIALAFIMMLGAAEAFAADINILVNGEELTFDSAPFMDGETVMVPFRFVAEKLGAKVSWHQETRTVFSEYQGSIITLQIENELLFANNTTYKNEKTPVIVNDRTMVSLDVFKNAMGIDAVMNENTVTIVK